MTLPATPTMQLVNTELGRAPGSAWDMNNDLSARQLALASLTPGVPWALSSLAGKSCYVQTMGVGNDGGIFGFNDPALGGGNAYGFMSPRVVAGAVVYGLNNLGACTVKIQGALPPGFWTTIEFKDSLASQAFARVYSSQAATYSVIGGGAYTLWSNFPFGPDLAARLGSTIYALFMN